MAESSAMLFRFRPHTSASKCCAVLRKRTVVSYIGTSARQTLLSLNEMIKICCQLNFGYFSANAVLCSIIFNKVLLLLIDMMLPRENACERLAVTA